MAVGSREATGLLARPVPAGAPTGDAAGCGASPARPPRPQIRGVTRSPSRSGLLPSPGAACTGCDPCRKSPSSDGENVAEAREHGEGWLEFFSSGFFSAEKEGKAVPPRRKVHWQEAEPSPARSSMGPVRRASEKRVLGGLFQESQAPATGTRFCRSGCAANAHPMGAPELPENKPSPPENPRPPKGSG